MPPPLGSAPPGRSTPTAPSRSRRQLEAPWTRSGPSGSSPSSVTPPPSRAAGWRRPRWRLSHPAARSCRPSPARAPLSPTPSRLGRRTSRPQDTQSEAHYGGPIPALASVARTPRLDERMPACMLTHCVAKSARAETVNDRGLVQAGERRVVEVAVENLERFLHFCPAQVERRRDGPCPVHLQTRGRARQRGRRLGSCC